MGIYPKIPTSINWCMNTSDMPLKDGPRIVTKASPKFLSSFRDISMDSTVKEDVEEEGEFEEC